MLTTTLFEAVVGNLLYYPRNYPSLPRLIAAVHDGDISGLGSILEAMVMEAAESDIADQIAVECRDRPHLRTPVVKDTGPIDRVHGFGICAEWSNLGPPPVVPAGTTVPALVLAGQFDPVAGSALSRQVADEIGAHALWVEFPGLGHNVRIFSPCATGIVSRFIERPEATPDTSCRLRRPPIPFLWKSEKYLKERGVTRFAGRSEPRAFNRPRGAEVRCKCPPLGRDATVRAAVKCPLRNVDRPKLPVRCRST